MSGESPISKRTSESGETKIDIVSLESVANKETL